MDLTDLKVNPNNPQIFDDLSKLKDSVEQFPKMFKYRPMVYDTDGTMLGGNKRLICLQELGFKEIPDHWAVCADDLTEEEKQRFIIADNLLFGTWDYEKLENWNSQDLEDWGLEIAPKIEDIEQSEIKEDFKEQIDNIKDENSKYPIVPEFAENYNAFIIVCKNEIDETFIRNLLKIEQPVFSNENGLSDRLSNVIDVEHIKRAFNE